MTAINKSYRFLLLRPAISLLPTIQPLEIQSTTTVFEMLKKGRGRDLGGLVAVRVMYGEVT
jgi:hypothetical protein